MDRVRPADRSWVDEVAGRFERAWGSGERPRVADFLGAEAGPRRALLVEELVRVEVQLRAAAGEMPRAEEYRRLFPGHVAAVDAAFGTAAHPRAARPDAGRNLLFGLLALQNDFVDRVALLAAFAAWVADKSQSLGQILRDRGSLDAATHSLLEALVTRHLERHGDDPGRSLAALSSIGTARRDLESVADPDLRASLDRVATDGETHEDPYATRVEDPGRGRNSGPRFRILKHHASGGLGEVYLARDEELHREVALKEIRDRYADDPASRSRFVVEAEITGNLEHPGIIPVYGLGTYGDGRPFYAMRFIKGDSLHEAIGRFHAGVGPVEHALALQKLLRRFLDVCYAMAYAHGRGVLHRDLKPRNIMLGPYGETLVVDWGLAKSVGRKGGLADTGEGTLHPESGGGDDATRAGSQVGTPAYMSPEQAAGAIGRLGPASDVYSLGATLYCLLTGRAPFEGRDLEVLLEKVRRGEFPTPRAASRAVAPALEAICLKAMARAPEGRYASAQSLADDIEHWLAGEPVSVFRDPWPARLKRWSRRHRWAAPAAVAVALLVLLLPSVAFVLVREFAKREAVEARSLLERQQAQARHQAAEDRQRALTTQMNNFRAHIAAFNDSRAVRRVHRPGTTSRALTLMRDAWHRFPVPSDPMNLRGEIIECLGETEIGGFRDPEGRVFFDHPIQALAVGRGGGRLAVALASPHGIDHVRKVVILQFNGDTHRPGESHFEVRSELSWGQAASSDHRARGPGRPGAPLEVARALWSRLVEKLDVARELAISPDGRRVALGTSAGDLYLWDLDGPGPGRPPARWHAHDGGIHGLSFGPDSRSLFSAGDDRVLARWNLAEGPGGRPEAGPRHSAESRIGRLVQLDGGRRLFAARDGRLCEFAPDSLECRDAGLDLSGYRPDVLDLSPDGRFAAVATDAGVEVIALEGGVRMRTLVRAGRELKDPVNGTVSALQFDPSGSLLLEIRADPSFQARGIYVWEVATGREVLVWGARQGEAAFASFAPDGGHLFMTDHRMAHEQWVLFDYPVVPARARETVALTARPPTSVALAADGATLACLSPTGTGPDGRQYEVTLWGTSDGRLLKRRLFDGAIRGPVGPRQLVFDLRGDRLALVETGGIRLWDLARDDEVRWIETGEVRPFRAFPRDGLLWGSIDEGADARLVPLHVDRPWSRTVPSPTGEDRIPTGVDFPSSCFASWGDLVLVGTRRGTVEAFRDGKSPARVASWGGLLPNVPIYIVAVSPDGKLAAFGNRSGQIQLRRLPGGEVLGEVNAHDREVSSLAFSGDGRSLASGGGDGIVRVWRTGVALRDPLVLPSARPGVGALALGFSPDGDRLWAYGANENAVRCWRLDRLEALLRDLGVRLEEILRGEVVPADTQERLQLATLCYERSLYVASTRFYEEAFAAEPSLADSLNRSIRYNAACCAALAGSGRALDDPKPDGATRAAHREKARGWLRADLAAWAGVLDGGNEAARKGDVARMLAHWRADADLAGLRDEAELAGLPEAEREACRALWSDVADLSRRADARPTPSPAR